MVESEQRRARAERAKRPRWVGRGRARWLTWVLLWAGLTLGGCAVDPGELEVWRFAIEETRGSVQDAYAQEFKRLIEERTGGEVEVIVYPYGTLGTSNHITEQLYAGTIQFAMASPGHLGTLIPEVQVLLLHFVLPDEDVNRIALADPALLEAFDELYAEKGMRFLAVFSEGWQAWTANRPIRRPEDFQGLRFRVMTTALLLAAYNAYGASATPMPFAEVYSALQLGMIDGQVNPVFAIQEMSFFEVQRYLTFANQAPFVATAAANRDFYEGLPPERQVLIDEVIAELDVYIDEVQRRYNRERLDQMVAVGHLDTYVAQAREALEAQRIHLDETLSALEEYGVQMASEEDTGTAEERMRRRRDLLDPVVEALAELNAHSEQTERQTRAATLDRLRSRAPHLEVIHLTEAERERFRELSLPVRDRFVSMTGPRGEALLEVLLQAVERAQAEVAARREAAP